jgi:COMPASS component SWD3
MELNINDGIEYEQKNENNKVTKAKIIKYPLDINTEDIPECLVLRYEFLNNQIALGYSNGNILIQNLLNNNYKVLNYSFSSITSLRWKPYSQSIPKNVLLSIDTEGNIIYWHTTTGKILHRIEEKEGSPLCLDYNNEGNLFAVGFDDKTIRIYDENMKIVVNKIFQGSGFQKGHTSRINSVCFEDNIIISGGWDGKILLHDIREDSVVSNEIIIGPVINGDCIDKMENKLLIGDKKNIRLYDLRNYKQIQMIETDSKLYCSKFNKVYNNFAFGGASNNLMYLYKYTNDKIKPIIEKNGLFKPTYTLDFSYDGNFLAYSGADPTLNIISI